MSAIDTTFHWDKNPTAINGLQTTYVSKRGNDTTGEGTAQKPYASIAKVTSVATAGTNIMIDDGEWSEARTANNRAFRWWGNTKTKWQVSSFIGSDYFYNIHIDGNSASYQYGYIYLVNGISSRMGGTGLVSYNSINIFTSTTQILGTNSIFFRCTSPQTINFANCILDTSPNSNVASKYYKNNNFTNSSINSTSANGINNASCNQNLADYFNYVPQIIIDNYNSASLEDWLQCDFTAKEGSANIGAGEKGTNIGLNQGYTMYADNSADSVFKISNGATLKNIEWNSTLNGYTLIQKERICAGATANTITLDSSASSEDDYYNNLFVGIVAGDGYGELFLITDYDGTTKTATIDGTWTATPTTNSIYTISGTILSAVKDFGKVIKVKRNWTFADNLTALQDGQWAEFMTHVETNGKQFPTSCYSYEYSTDGVNFVQGQTADDLVSAINGENKVTDAIYGDSSPNYNEATAKNLVMRYIRVRVHIGFNIN